MLYTIYLFEKHVLDTIAILVPDGTWWVCVFFMSDIEQIKTSHSELKRLIVENFGIEEDVE